MMEDSIELGVDIRLEDVHKVFKVGDGDRIKFWVVSTDEPNGQVMLCLIAVPEAAPVSHLLADHRAHESNQSTLRMRTAEPGIICLKDFVNFNNHSLDYDRGVLPIVHPLDLVNIEWYDTDPPDKVLHQGEELLLDLAGGATIRRVLSCVFNPIRSGV